MTKRIKLLLSALAISVVLAIANRVHMAMSTLATRQLRSELVLEFSQSVARQTLDCSRDARLDAAMLNYKVGCLLATIRICSSQDEPTKFDCYKRGQAECDQFSINYRAWLSQGK